MDAVGLLLFVIGGLVLEETWRKRMFLPIELAKTMLTGGFLCVLTAVIIWRYL
jgi:hypothetical protein